MIANNEMVHWGQVPKNHFGQQVPGPNEPKWSIRTCPQQTNLVNTYLSPINHKRSKNLKVKKSGKKNVKLLIIFLIIRRRKNRGYAEEYTGIPFSNYDDDYNQEDYQDEDQDYEEVPRALSKNKAKRNKFFDDIPRKEENQYLSDVEDYNNSKDKNNNNDDIASIKEKYLKNFEKNNFGTDEYEDDYEDERQL